MTDEVREGFQAPQERTLRDEFAMKAMAAIITSPVVNKRSLTSGYQIATGAYEIADAMMEARK